MKKKLCVLYKLLTSEIDLIDRINVQKDMEFLDLLWDKYMSEKKKSDDEYVTRSFLQYKCQFYYLSCWKKIILNVTSAFVIPLFVCFSLVNNFFRGNSIKTKNEKDDCFAKNIALRGCNIRDDLIPESLKKEYHVTTVSYKRFLLDVRTIVFVCRYLYRYIMHPYFVLKILVKIAQHKSLLLNFKSSSLKKAIITASEYSFSSSILTLYLNERGVQHINVMHGEKIFCIGDGFFAFNRFYVWDDYYVELFKKLKAFPGQFFVETPPKHRELLKSRNYKYPNNVIKFYWASEIKRDELEFIAHNLIRLKSHGYDVWIRFHPLQRDYFLKHVYPLFKDMPIEDPREVEIEESLRMTEYVLGTYTTVLYEAYLMKRKLIINDFNYDKLKKIGCIIFEKKIMHEKLSSFGRRRK